MKGPPRWRFRRSRPAGPVAGLPPGSACTSGLASMTSARKVPRESAQIVLLPRRRRGSRRRGGSYYRRMSRMIPWVGALVILAVLAARAVIALGAGACALVLVATFAATETSRRRATTHQRRAVAR